MSPIVCSSCDGRIAATPQGLCGPCQDTLRFITRPAAHRETWRRALAAQHQDIGEWEQRGVFVITSAPDPNDLWMCDLCNGIIPVDDEHTLIPLIGSYALCAPCVTGIEYWPDAWTYPTPRACPCDACQLPLQRQTLRDRSDRDLHRPGWEIGR